MTDRQVKIYPYRFSQSIGNGIFWIAGLILVSLSIYFSLSLLFNIDIIYLNKLFSIILIVFMLFGSLLIIIIAHQHSKFNRKFIGGQVIFLPFEKGSLHKYPLEKAIKIITNHVGEVKADNDFFKMKWSSTQVVMIKKSNGGYFSLYKDYYHQAMIAPGSEVPIYTLITALEEIRREMINNNKQTQELRKTKVITNGDSRTTNS